MASIMRQRLEVCFPWRAGRAARLRAITASAKAQAIAQHAAPVVMEPVPCRAVRTSVYEGPPCGQSWRSGDDNSEMGADLFGSVNHRGHPRLHRDIGGIGGYRPLPLLRLCRDLPCPADPWAHDFQGIGPPRIRSRRFLTLVPRP